MIEELLVTLRAFSIEELMPLLYAGLGGLVCFIPMSLKINRLKRENSSLSLANKLQEERLNIISQHALEKEAFLQNSADEMRLQFKDLAQRIFDEKSRSLASQNNEALDILMRPFREQLKSFKERVDTIFHEETRERASLKKEVQQLRDLNQQINEEARNLTKAITGNRQTQGAWGEIILEKLLEQSGLRKGYEYESQVGLRDRNNRLFKPDIIIHLPDDKDIIIDSKVSLSAWSRFVASEDDASRSRALKEHLQALRNHLTTLNEKDYSSLKGLRSLDFVLMFIPIDAAFMTALQREEKLISEMYSRKIIIVSPTTLLATLRTIEHIWQLERQNHNALEIANRASLLYDKLRGFLEDMDKLGKQLDTCRDSYDRAMNKMSRGRGNLVAQASQFPELGVQIKKELPRNLVTDAEQFTEIEN